MAANVENMFFVGRETPWHGLGISVESAPLSADALVAAGLDWNVTQKEIFLPDGKLVGGYVANVRETDGQLLGVVTNRYKICQNTEAFSFVDTLLGEGVRYETAGSLAKGKRVWMLARLPEEYRMLDDAIEPYLVFTNSHDGKGAIMAAMTPIRVVCQNTLNLALNRAPRVWKTHHTGNVESKMEEAMLTLKMGQEYMKNLSAEAWQMAKVKLPDEKVEEYIKLLIPDVSEDATDRRKNSIRELQESLWYRYTSAPDLQHIGKNGLRFVHAVSDFATHQEPLRRTSTFKENLFARTIDGNAMIDKAYSIIQAVA